MYLTSDKKKEIFRTHGKSDADTGSPEGQIALFTFRIQHLTQHLKQKPKDKSTERSLILLVGNAKHCLITSRKSTSSATALSSRSWKSASNSCTSFTNNNAAESIPGNAGCFRLLMPRIINPVFALPALPP
jgi:small subunit ribosomal protein S15